MILSKQNLEIYKVPQEDKGIPVLNNVHVTAEGASVAANSKSFICVSPVTDVVKKSLPLGEGDVLGADGTTISLGLAREVCAAIPSDSQFEGLTEHVSISEPDELVFEITDGRRKKTLRGKKFERPYIKYIDFMKKIFSRKPRRVKMVVNRKRLLTLISVIEKLCTDKTGHSLLYVEVTQENELVLRAINPRTGQHVAAFMSSYDSQEEDYIESNEWEKKFSDTAKISR
jgi:hypothetical protein